MPAMDSRIMKPLTIGRLAEQADVGVDTVRFYERRGLLPEPDRTPAGYRIYAGDTVARLRFIRRAKSLGFSLDEIKTLLQLHDSGGDKSEVKKLTGRKLLQIDTRISDLTRIRKVLAELAQQCSGSGDIGGCPIIEALATEEH
jgi:Hg(II)-responsive transcriptional regulator